MHPAPASKKPRKPKPYVPSFRSGAYALVVALSSLPEGLDAGLTKPQLIERAQEHCDSSFTAPADTSKHHTAWNSMNTLTDKDLVYIRGRPLRRYYLSDEGWELARVIKNVQGDGGLKDVSRDDRAMPQHHHESSGHVTNSTSRVFFGDLLLSPTRPLHITDTEDAKEVSTSDSFVQGRRLGATIGDKFMNQATCEKSKSTEKDTRSSRECVEIFSSPEPPSQSAPTKPRQITRQSDEDLGAPVETVISHRERETLSPGNRVAESDLHPSTINPILIPPGSFTVELVLDSREVRAKNDRDYIEGEFTKKGLRVSVRPLELGDFVWVAKLKDPELLRRHGEEGDEVMLDWIVERKRLDDLVSSIKDGRFQEQKFRLRRMGIGHVVYIIEDFGMHSDTRQQYHEGIVSAIASTQVVHGYFVKQTRKLDDTIRYLTRMTMMLKRVYEVCLILFLFFLRLGLVGRSLFPR